MSAPTQHKPTWLKVPLPHGEEFRKLDDLVRQQGLVTVCREAQCPNRGECWAHGSASFMVCGEVCTRACAFCATRTAKPAPLDPGEPERVALAVQAMQLRHTLVTMVTRDDLPDGGAAHMASVIRAIRKRSPECIIEVLTSDFGGNEQALEAVIDARPHIFNHNLETVERLTPLVRFRAQYRRSLHMLHRAGEIAPGLITTKSGMMLGLGESRGELLQSMQDLLDNGVRMLTLGQYLQPTPRHLPVIEYITPDCFRELRDTALAMGFEQVAAGPLIRSSHFAANFRPREEVLAALQADLRRRGMLPVATEGSDIS